MALLDVVKVFNRKTGNELDAQWNVLINAALADMRDKGVDPDLLPADDEPENEQVIHAVALYCQAYGGFIDNSERESLKRCYLDAVCHLMAHHNVREVDE